MSTIASPRPSVTLSSRRTSTSTDTTNTARSPSSSRPPASAAGTLRRNRAALRDYYGLKNAAPADARAETPPTPTLDTAVESELDKPDFNVESYVEQLLAREGLEGVLRVEAGLVSEIRSLDGEKKALVYDNYSKLIAATETIRRMRESMDPGVETRTLMDNIEKIGASAAELSGEMRKAHGTAGDDQASVKRREQQQTVRWVIRAPERLREMMAKGQRAEAEQEWKDVTALLEMWQGFRGTDDVKRACESAMQQKTPE